MARRKKQRSGGIWKFLNTVLPSLAFVSQITTKDRAGYAAQPTLTKLQSMVNNITGNMFGINFFGGGASQFTEQWNPAAIANKYTGIGLAGIGIKVLSRAVLKPMKINVPYLGRISSVATKFLPSGVIGGLFDSVTTTNYTPQTGNFQTYTNGEYNTPSVGR